MIKEYGTYKIIKEERINDDIAFLVGHDSQKEFPYICMEYHIEHDTAHYEERYQSYGEAMADLYERCLRNYEIDMEALGEAIRQSYEHGPEL